MNIIITGMMGVGKTSVGRILANRLGLSFIDMDRHIEKEHGMSVEEIFNTQGERYFRKAEQDACQKLSKSKNRVIATGGKSLLYEKNLEKMASTGLIVTLLCRTDDLYQRIKTQNSRRPLLQADFRKDIENIYKQRETAYWNLPNKIETSGLSIVQVVRKILDYFRGEETKITMNVSGKDSSIFVKRGLFSGIGRYLQNIPHDGRIFILSDKTVFSLYGKKLHSELEKAGEDISFFFILPGEKSKNIKNLEKIYNWLYTQGASRSSLFMCFGGGVVSDLGGLAASSYCRGMPLVNVPTTLLGQIDAGIGGKNGINWGDGKNQIGSFYFPEKVLIDPLFLATLNIKQMREGLVEALKAGMIGDRSLFQSIKDNPRILLFKDLARVEELIKKSVELKVKVTGSDPFEHKQRKTLNLGHTFAHALESFFRYKRLTHGEAVGLGLICAAKMGTLLKITSPEVLDETRRILRQWKVPFKLRSLDAVQALSLMKYDKKRKGKRISFILPLKIGSVEIKDDIDDTIVLESFKEIIEDEKDIDR